ncbi:MAG: hypothetical protein BV456_00665 [Thermoplasmata archaeon M8B2D]|nr:MAG: hypothetical protein BV456_00665 [Thermoplasmata archaeon M8B2D]
MLNLAITLKGLYSNNGLDPDKYDGYKNFISIESKWQKNDKQLLVNGRFYNFSECFISYRTNLSAFVLEIEKIILWVKTKNRIYKHEKYAGFKEFESI